MLECSSMTLPHEDCTEEAMAPNPATSFLIRLWIANLYAGFTVRLVLQQHVQPLEFVSFLSCGIFLFPEKADTG